MRHFFALLAVVLFLATGCVRGQSDDLDTQLMLNTFKIVNSKSSATVFIVTRPTPGDEKRTQYVIVTAGHVFSKMEGDEATLYLRKRDLKDPDDWNKMPVKLKIRSDGKQLWTKHPTADVATMQFTPPGDTPVIGLPLDYLATDEKLKLYEIHPGDAVRCVGYPHPGQFNSGPAWFPVVRAGCIAGYPLIPAQKYKTFLTDFNCFEGNSGGPVYLAETNRYYGGKTQEGRVQLILGLLSEQHFIDFKFENPYQSGMEKHRLGLGVIVNGTMIRETIDQLPKPGSKPEEK